VSQRIPEGAFEFYMGLGPTRSYAAVAEKYGVTKRAVVKHAAREKWSERLETVQREARDELDKRLAGALAEMNERHMKMLRAMASRAVAGMKEHPLGTGMEAIRAAELVIKLERLVAGEASERTSLNVEEVTRQEMQRWLVPAGDTEDES